MTVNIRFDPFERDDQPPEPTRITSILRCQTPLKLETVPSRWVLETTNDLIACHTTSFKLPPLCLIPNWTPHEVDRSSSTLVTSRPSASQSDFAPSTYATTVRTPSYALSPGFHWTTSIAVPIVLPESKIFSPSFHSCTIAQSTVSISSSPTRETAQQSAVPSS
jgi:hypothetical protein